MSGRTRILYLGPWVDYGGTDKGTIDWFRWLDRDRYAGWLMTTQPSANRRLAEVLPFAEEVWPLPELTAGKDFPEAIFALIHDRQIDVVHMMNSRLAYELLPDLGCLPNPPAVVVQLHVEEPDRSGYVRYVTSRFGNLVNGFSVTSHQLAAAVEGYGVPRDRIRVIYTGVDPDDEFSPSGVAPIDRLRGEGMRILYPGRIVEQKDPLLMVDVAAGLAERTPAFHVHAVGEGDLEPAVRAAVAERDLGGQVSFRASTSKLRPWYASCDALLMTSRFEGVPYVVFEAMAMGLPVVVPALPGNRELVTPATGVLVDPRDDVDAYADALAELVEDPGLRMRLGSAARARVMDHFSLRQMARGHEQLYDDLLAERATRSTASDEPTAPGGHPAHTAAPAPIRFHDRPPYGQPLVSVVVPCFNHGRFLPEAIESVRHQTYPAIETIVVDDGSTDQGTRDVLDELEGDDVRLLRLEENSGPSVARNAAIDVARGRYVLPLDADNVLLPNAVADLVTQLQAAGERVGFIYPNLQFTGNRTDYFEAPDYNLHRLFKGNYCDTCSLFDRRIFDAGARFPEAIRLGHEDWDFVLSLAEHEVYGEAARTKTLLYRKWGFNRSDSVEHAASAFGALIVRRHPYLYKAEAEHKSAWSPALSVIALDEVGSGAERGRLARCLAEQSALDFEVIARFDGLWPESGNRANAPTVRRIPPGAIHGAAEMLALGRAQARGPYLLAVAGSGKRLMQDPALVEKVLRVFIALEALPLDAIVFADAGDAGTFPLKLFRDNKELPRLAPHAVAVRVAALEALGESVPLEPGQEIAGVVSALVRNGSRVQWRHAPAELRRPEPPGPPAAMTRPPTPIRRGARSEREYRLQAFPALPRYPQRTVPRWMHAHTYLPSSCLVLCRHRRDGDEHRVVTRDHTPPPGYVLEYELGALRIYPLEGTSRLVAAGTDDYVIEARDQPEADTPGRRTLGYVEDVPFVGLEGVILGTHRLTRQPVLACGPDDPLLHEIIPSMTLGYLDSVPISPRHEPHAELPIHGVGLIRCVDLEARRHRYGAGRIPSGRPTGELGALIDRPGPGRIPVWVSKDGTLRTGPGIEKRRRPETTAAVRWTLAPARWGDFSGRGPRARAIARRALEATKQMAVARSPHADLKGSPPAGYLLSDARPNSVPLYFAVHPVTGDELLTRNPVEAGDMGYGSAELLGHLLAVAPLTGSLTLNRVPVPWASRFGLAARQA